MKNHRITSDKDLHPKDTEFHPLSSEEPLDLQPNFELQRYGIGVDELKEETQSLPQRFDPIPHGEIFQRLLDQIQPVDFREIAELDADEKLTRKHYLVCVVNYLLELARKNDWGICRSGDFTYLYNGAYWKPVEDAELQAFLGEAAGRMGVNKFDSQWFNFCDQLLKQCQFMGYLPRPEPRSGTVTINLRNGTFVFQGTDTLLRNPERDDFLTYQLPFDYDPAAEAPLFRAYLDRVLPDKDLQMILAEFLGYVFTDLKLEKTLILYGDGANGKSVFFEVVNALLGAENVSSYSLQNLTRHDGYQRAELANKLVNYASEINGNLESSIFKQLASGEPVEARQIYGRPFTMKRYARLIFNCNELPKDVEHTHAYFRRFQIIPFGVQIPEAEQDRELPHKIIARELSGIFNWVLEGLKRLLAQKGFTYSHAAQRQVEQYRKESDSVQMFLEDEGYQPSTDHQEPLKDLHNQYRIYCGNSGYRLCSLRTFADRLRKVGYETQKKNIGQVVYLKKNLF
jgi:putative DNA primase/helicase